MNFLRSLTKYLSETTTLNIFLVIHTLIGKYSINSDSKVISLFTAIYCVLIGVFLVIFRLRSGKIFRNLFQSSIFNLSEFLLHLVLYLHGKNKKFITFYSDIKNIDAKMDIPETPLVTTSWKYFVLRAIIFSIVKSVIWFHLIRSLVHYYAILFVFISNDITCAHRILIMYILNDRVKLLKEKFIKDLKHSLDIEQNNIAVKITKLNENLQIYDNLIDTFDGLNLHLQLSVRN